MMKIKLSTLKYVISESAIQISDINNTLAMYAVRAGGSTWHILYDPGVMKKAFVSNNKEEALNALYGMIVTKPRKVNSFRVEEVTSIAAKKGYGPLLSDYVMNKSPIIADVEQVSVDAENMFAYYYYRRSDVEHIPIEDESILRTNYDSFEKQGEDDPLNFIYKTTTKQSTGNLFNNSRNFLNDKSIPNRKNLPQFLLKSADDWFFQKQDNVVQGTR